MIEGDVGFCCGGIDLEGILVNPVQQKALYQNRVGGARNDFKDPGALDSVCSLSGNSC